MLGYMQQCSTICCHLYHVVGHVADGAVCCGSIALLAGAVAHVISCRHMDPPSASLQAWEGLATQACLQLLEVCTSHPNQKKVYTAIMTKQLLLLLAQAIWQPHQTPRILPAAAQTRTHGVSSRTRQSLRLTAAAKHLLHAVIFHSSNTAGMVELGTCFSDSSNHSGQGAAGTNHKASALRSYQFELLQVI